MFSFVREHWPIFVITTISAFVVILYGHFFFPGFYGLSDACDYADLGRNIAEGKGFVNHNIYPLSLCFPFLRELPQPTPLWPPGYPLILAGAFRLFSPSDTTVLWLNTILLLLTVPLVYVLGLHFYNRRVASLAALFFGTSQFVLYLLIIANSEIVATFLFTAFLLLVLKGRRILSYLIAGLLLGILLLTRYPLIFILPAIFIYLKKEWRFEFKKFVWLLILPLLLVLPWLVRNYLLFGSPFFALQNYGEVSKATTAFSDYYHTYRSLEPQPFFSFIFSYPLFFLRKVTAGILMYIREVPEVLNLYLFFFFLLSFFNLKKGNEKVVHFRILIVSLFLFYVLFHSVFGPYIRHLAFLLPGMMVIASANLLDLWSKLNLKEGYKRFLFPLLILFLLVPTKTPERERYFLERKLDHLTVVKHCEEIKDFLDQESVVASDVSDALGWYARAPAMWFPVDHKNFLAADSIIPVGGIYLQKGLDSEWIGDHRDDPEGITILDGTYFLVKDFESGAVFYKKVSKQQSEIDCTDSKVCPRR